MTVAAVDLALPAQYFAYRALRAGIIHALYVILKHRL
jgi:hypothetical protein